LYKKNYKIFFYYYYYYYYLHTGNPSTMIQVPPFLHISGWHKFVVAFNWSHKGYFRLGGQYMWHSWSFLSHVQLQISIRQVGSLNCGKHKQAVTLSLI